MSWRPGAGGRSRLAALGACLALAIGLAACSGARQVPVTRPGAPAGSGATSRAAGLPGSWILTERALRQVGDGAAVRAVLASAKVFEIVPLGGRPLNGLAGVPTVSFASYARMSAAFAEGRIAPWVRAILYDNEAWSATPLDEQLHPGATMADAAALVHRHGLVFIAAPALSLATALAPGASSRASAYLELDLAAQAARMADVLDIQAQSTERNAAGYGAFVRRAAAQARAANPAVVVLAGISTNPPGGPVTLSDLLAALRASSSTVDGYWLNIPSPGPRCPGCGPPMPELGIALLRSLAGGS